MITLISDKELSESTVFERICPSAIFDQDLIPSVLYDRKSDTYFYVKEDAIAVTKLFHKLDRLVQKIEENRSTTYSD
jgi:hypothetical protein